MRVRWITRHEAFYNYHFPNTLRSTSWYGTLLHDNSAWLRVCCDLAHRSIKDCHVGGTPGPDTERLGRGIDSH